MEPVAPRPAAPAPPSEPRPARRPLGQRIALALLLIAAAALIGYTLSRSDDGSADPDVLTRSAEAAGRLQLVLETGDPLEAKGFVLDEFGWRVGVPVFEIASLRGVAIAEVAPAVEVPVFLYNGADAVEVAVFAYSYALFDQVPDRLRLDASDYADLTSTAPVSRHIGGTDFLLWRDRDDIYVAVTDLHPQDLANGLSVAR